MDQDQGGLRVRAPLITAFPLVTGNRVSGPDKGKTTLPRPWDSQPQMCALEYGVGVSLAWPWPVHEVQA